MLRFFVLFSCCLTFYVQSCGQDKIFGFLPMIGVSVMPQLSDVHGIPAEIPFGNDFSHDFRLGYRLGVKAGLMFTTNTYFRSGLFYSSQGLVMNYNNLPKHTLRINYLQLPIIFGQYFYVKKSKTLHLSRLPLLFAMHMGAGPALNLMLNADKRIDSKTYTNIPGEVGTNTYTSLLRPAPASIQATFGMLFSNCRIKRSYTLDFIVDYGVNVVHKTDIITKELEPYWSSDFTGNSRNFALGIMFGVEWGGYPGSLKYKKSTCNCPKR